MRFISAAFLASVMIPAGVAGATDLEVTHWWTSGGEAAAVAELAKAFDATGNKWVDGAIAGSGGTARPIMISRITGGDPMGATQFNHGRQAEELVQAGLMRDLTDVAEKGKWKDVIKPASLLDSCTIDGKIYCAPVNIHSWQWLWLSNEAFKKAGVEVPKNCPPTFLVHTDDDRSSSLGAVLFYAGLKKHGIPAELHVYGNGGHGYGLRPVSKSQISSWPDHAAHWLGTRGFLK